MLIWTLLSVLLWQGCVVAFLWGLGQLWLPLVPERAFAGMVLALVFAMVLASLAGQLTSTSAPIVENFVFWLVRCQLAVAPCLAVLLALLLGLRGPMGAMELQLGLLTAATVAILMGGTLVVVLLRLRERAEAATVRWLLAAAALILALELSWSAVAPPGLRGLIAFFVAALGAGVLRPLSWAWEAPLSLGLMLAGRLGAPVATIRASHPVTLDELSLLPLPGLSSALARACADELDEGAEWLLAVAAHPGQERAAHRALQLILRRRRHIHPLLFWLSTTPEGANWLQHLDRRGTPVEELVTGYAALTAVETPDWWPVVIERHRPAFAAAAPLPGGAAVLALLDTGRHVLQADRWPAALGALRRAAEPVGAGDDPIWVALRLISGWARDPQPAFVTDQEQLLSALLAEIADLQGWPVDLIAAMAEHLRYLIRIEQQRGALLV
jgi:hypothetical protein